MSGELPGIPGRSTLMLKSEQVQEAGAEGAATRPPSRAQEMLLDFLRDHDAGAPCYRGAEARRNGHATPATRENFRGRRRMSDNGGPCRPIGPLAFLSELFAARAWLTGPRFDRRR